ncbi:MAG TPA: DUF4249 family protein [Cyclobacteriaceae bacterium]|nr:DUF4249 family protein [Cyclobacteriaceae bacterium]HPW62028.1 DUF4249 family protein [Cyclobacteriaceae bacterium]
MKIRNLLLIFFCVLAACEERLDIPLLSEDKDLLAVEGVLTNENISHTITLTFPYKMMNGKAVPVSGAVVQILEGNSATYTLTEAPAGSGQYVTPKFRAVFGTTYTLWIQYQGKEYFAQDSSVPVEPLPALDYYKVNDQYSLAFNESGQNASYIDHRIDWTTTADCLPGNTCEGRIVFYDLKTIDVNEIYKPGKTDFLFPVNSIIIRKKYSVSSAYRTFLRSMLSETEWRGGLFDVERANATTNLSSGAIGFFAVTSVVSDTTLVVEKP